MTNDCPRAGHWIGGCKFEARYDRIPPSDKATARFEWRLDAGPILDRMAKKIYVRDVCTRCGKTIERGA
jgi:hypothetical protein